MGVESVTFLVVLMVLSLGLGISGFIGNKTEYSSLSYAVRPLFAGLLLLVFFVTGFIQSSTTEAATYLLSYFCFALGIVFLASGVAVAISGKVSNFWWRLVRRTEQKEDRKNLVIVMLILSFGFFFAFFLFYPPFISIG